jgi:excisionase family DNA binding protein
MKLEGKLLYSRGTTAQLLNVCLRSVDHLTEAGTLETVKIGRRRLIKAESIYNFCRSNQPRNHDEHTEDSGVVPATNLETHVNA